ncbi:MAG: serine hydrolase domain-containing protein, partial [Kofleriaceae bacterium]
MHRAFALALALAACHASAAAPRAPKPALPSTLDPAAIDAWLAAELADRGVVGAQLVIVHEGATVLAKGYGTRSAGAAEPVTPDTPFAIGSVSKQLTCAAANLLADDGKLGFEDKVAKYYPELVRAADISLDDLGAHFSGYRDYYPLDYMDARMAAPIAPDDLLAKYAGMPLDFEPRSRWSYSNTGFVLLGRVVEKVSGLAFGTFLEQRIFQPLEMTHTRFGPPPTAAAGHTAFLVGPVVRAAAEADGWAIGAFGVYSTANDLARWDLAFS